MRIRWKKLYFEERYRFSRLLKAWYYPKTKEKESYSVDIKEWVCSPESEEYYNKLSLQYPVVFLHGVAPRSGTNYLNALLEKHPNLCSCPGNIYEFPFLTHIDEFEKYKNTALHDYQRNEENIYRDDLLSYFGLGLVQYLYSRTESGKIPLVKEPSVRNLGYFHRVFNGQKLLLLIRDGRDVVQSTVSSWPGWTIKDASIRWANSARLMMEYNKNMGKDKRCLLVRYEDLVENTSTEMKRICEYLNISGDLYRGNTEQSIPIIGSSTHSKKSGRVHWGEVEKTDDFKHKNKWENWTIREKSIFKKYADKALIASGYEKTMNW